MNALYKRARETTQKLLVEYGQKIVISRNPDRQIDPVTGDTVIIGAELHGEFTVINPPASDGKLQAFDNRIIGEAALINKMVRFFVVVAKDAPFEPMANDTLIMDDENFSILGVTAISPAGVPIAYRLGVAV